MNEYFRRPQDLINAVRSLGRLGLSISLPDLKANGQMFFRIEGREISVTQILELHDKNRLDPSVVRGLGAPQKTDAAKCGM